MENLYKLFLKTQQNLLETLSSKDKLGLSTYKERQLLKEVNEILSEMVDNAWNESGNVFYKVFQISKLDRKMGQLPLNVQEKGIVDRIVDTFMGNLITASSKVITNVRQTFKKSASKANLMPGDRNNNFIDLFKKTMSEQGLVAFTDKSGRNWSLQSYSDMLVRTSGRMATNYGVLFTYEHIDLYKISKHGTTCKICAPLEGRVYSRSGTHPYYPPLASAFGKIDKLGPNVLENTYLNIHPNCKHVLIPFKEEGRSAKEVEEIRKFSSFEENPPDRDPRTQEQVDRYKNKEQGRAKLMSDFREFQQMKLLLGDNMPKTFNTFQKHKLNNSNSYQNWKNLYKNMQ